MIPRQRELQGNVAFIPADISDSDETIEISERRKKKNRKPQKGIYQMETSDRKMCNT